MRHSTTKIALLMLALTIVFANPGFAQDDCKVLIDKLSGQYDGGCKKGLADGQGTAKGEDNYVGAFKKGLPHGTGTYTWANGDVYNGEFKKGLKDGQGKMTIKKADGQTEEQIRAQAEADGRGLVDLFIDVVRREVGDEDTRDRIARTLMEACPAEMGDEPNES